MFHSFIRNDIDMDSIFIRPYNHPNSGAQIFFELLLLLCVPLLVYIELYWWMKSAAGRVREITFEYWTTAKVFVASEFILILIWMMTWIAFFVQTHNLKLVDEETVSPDDYLTMRDRLKHLTTLKNVMLGCKIVLMFIVSSRVAFFIGVIPGFEFVCCC